MHCGLPSTLSVQKCKQGAGLYRFEFLEGPVAVVAGEPLPPRGGLRVASRVVQMANSDLYNILKSKAFGPSAS